MSIENASESRKVLDVPHLFFENKRFDPDKSIRFGFVATHGAHIYATDIAEGQFQMTVVVRNDGTVGAKVVDANTRDEYVLHRTPGACGAFVGMVRNDYENVLREVADKCFAPDVFKSVQARKVIDYVRKKYGGELEYLWPKFPTNAIFRRKDSRKWYGALIVLSKRKLGLDSDEVTDILDLRIDPAKLKSLVDGKRYFPGYHMSKNNWCTICLDGSVSIREIKRRIDDSYEMAI